MFSANDKSGEFSFDTGKQCDMNFARCVCFFQSNIFLPKFGIHVSYMNEDQFRKCYKDILVKMGCKTTSDIKQVEDEVKCIHHWMRFVVVEKHFFFNPLKFSPGQKRNSAANAIT